MKRGIGRLFNDLRGRADGELTDALVGQVDAVVQAIDVLRAHLGDSAQDPPVEAIRELEEAANDHRETLIKGLARSLTTPLDREDLFRLSRSIDDVLDNLCDFTREVQLYRPDSCEGLLPLLDPAADGIAALRRAVSALVDDPAQARGAAADAKDAGNRLRGAYQEAVAELFSGELDMEVVKLRELLRRLDVVALRLAEAADGLMDGLMKRP